MLVSCAAFDPTIESVAWAVGTPESEAARPAIVAVEETVVALCRADSAVGFSVHILKRCTAVSKLLQ